MMKILNGMSPQLPYMIFHLGSLFHNASYQLLNTVLTLITTYIYSALRHLDIIV